MIGRVFLGALCALAFAGCDSTRPLSFLRLQADDPAADGGDPDLDPIVAHFFNTAAMANAEAAVVAATQDGGSDADAGN